MCCWEIRRGKVRKDSAGNSAYKMQTYLPKLPCLTSIQSISEQHQIMNVVLALALIALFLQHSDSHVDSAPSLQSCIICLQPRNAQSYSLSKQNNYFLSNINREYFLQFSHVISLLMPAIKVSRPFHFFNVVRDKTVLQNKRNVSGWRLSRNRLRCAQCFSVSLLCNACNKRLTTRSRLSI